MMYWLIYLEGQLTPKVSLLPIFTTLRVFQFLELNRPYFINVIKLTTTAEQIMGHSN